MKPRIMYIFWGILFLLTGAGLLGEVVDFEHLTQQVKMLIFATASAAFFLTYFLEGVRKWGWLFPALICAAFALIIGMEISGMGDSPLASLPIMLSLMLPFYVGFALDHRRWGLLVPANILAALMIFTLLVEHINGQLLSALVFYATGLPFLVIYLMDRSKRWALISAEIMAAIGTMPLVAAVANGNVDVVAPAFLFLFGLCFLIVSYWSKKSWWAVIPGGFFASFGLVAALENLVPHQEYASLQNNLSFDVYIWVLFLGLAATFGALWLRRKTQPTGWAIYPAVALLVMAFLSFILGYRFQEVWQATVMLVIGGMLLLTMLVKKESASGQQLPEVKA